MKFSYRIYLRGDIQYKADKNPIFVDLRSSNSCFTRIASSIVVAEVIWLMHNFSISLSKSDMVALLMALALSGLF